MVLTDSGAATHRGGDRPLHLVDATMFWNPSGGVRRYVVSKREGLLRHGGWRHTVATPTPDAPGMLRIPSAPLPGSSGAYRLPWRRSAAAQLLIGAGPDLLESADPYRLAWSTLDAASALGVPAIAFCHSNLPRMASLGASGIGGRRLGAAAERAARSYLVKLYRRFDLVLAPSHSMTAALRDWGVERAERQPLGVDGAWFEPTRRLGPAWRSSLGVPPGARLLVYAGRFAPEKELPTITEAVRRLGAGVWLLALGAGPDVPRGERVLVRPPILEPALLAATLAGADAFVHAGAQETFGLSVLEAMACGLPVIARSQGGTGELVDASVGAAVETGTPAAYADAVASVLARDRDALGAAARRRALRYDWRELLPGLIRRYETLAGRPAPAARVATA